MIVVVMGVSGCGKTTVGRLLAERLGVAFRDADDYHPEANRRKMASGIPLDDEDRRPWLESLAASFAAWEAAGGAVLACSALKRRYRAILAEGGASDLRFVYLKGSKEMIAERMGKRRDHFMPPGLLDSQFAALEEPDPTEALIVDIAGEPEGLVEEILEGWNRK